MQCYETIWTDVGCLEEGFDYTPNASMLSREALENLNLRYFASVTMHFFITYLTSHAV